jgi:hypothetical protein
MTSKYDNHAVDRAARTGGAVRVTLSSNIGQGNGGTLLPCRGCWVQAVLANTDVVRMNIGSAASGTAGVDLARQHINVVADSYGAAAAQPLFIPISDVSQLYFYSATDSQVIDIVYLLG